MQFDGDEQLNQNTNNYIEQKQNMDEYHERSPSLHQQIFRASQIAFRSAANTPMLGFKSEFNNASYFIDHHTRNNLQQYEQQWEHNILNQMVRELQEGGKKSQKKMLRYPPVDHQQDYHLKNTHPTNRNKKKQMSKYKAYAVKMKIPQQQQDSAKAKLKQKQPRVGGKSESKNKSENRLRHEDHYTYQKGQDIFRVNVRDIAMYNNIFQSNGINIFKKRPQKTTKNNNIRKRSIKTSEKKNCQDLIQAKQSINKILKTSTSPKLVKKFGISLDQSTFQHNHHVQNSGENISNARQISKQREAKKLLTKSIKSPMRPEKEQRFALARNRELTMKVQAQQSKFIQKMEKAIHFKKKQSKPQSPVKEMKKQGQLQSIDKGLIRSNMNFHTGEGSKTLVKAIYTSKDVIRNKNNVLKQSISRDLQVSRRQAGNRKVFVFNSEDQYVRRILMKAGWIQNHDNRSQFYNLKWVFKPDSIDYHNLKPNQTVNHVQNSHELTAKNYLNKNLKSHISQWTSLNTFYPKSYDLGRASQKQDFYQQYKKQVMMIMLQNLYNYFFQLRTSYVQELTQFYMSVLSVDGTYETDTKSYSQLRNKNFRKIDMEDYKNYDNDFLVHMNLFIVALRYWRSFRKQQELVFDQEPEPHFLSFRQKQFENNFNYLEKYSKMSLPFNSSQPQSYFQMEYFATPSQTAIERLVKEYVYFQYHLKRQWRIFGKGNIWIVKPCSASRGNGIYLASDCSQILSDNRGIQSKVVQRYIERPLILNSGLVGGKKFDLRQWVLLRSVQPLQIYMFSHCYVRICSQDFDIRNINNLKAHLTNYSFNKKHYKRPSESVIDQDTFQQMLLQQRNINFVQHVRPKIKHIIINSIKSTQHLISDCNQRCFSLLGYDILLDADAQPWLLQINMSPACEERTQWLKSYLQIMGKQLLKIIQPDYLPIIANPVVSPPHWSKQPLQLKKIKTEMSQKSEDIFASSSYVNAIFTLDPKKEPIIQHFINQTQSVSSEGWELQKISSEQLVAQNELHNQEEQKIEQECLSNEGEMLMQQEEEDDKQIVNSQKFNNLELYLGVEDDNQLIRSPTKSEEPLLAQPSKQITQNKEIEQPYMNPMEGILKWQKICHEEYTAMKKDPDLQIQILGSKLTPDKLSQLDKYLDYMEAQQKIMHKKCVNLQKSIRNFLSHQRQQKKVANQIVPLKINVSKLMKKDSEREAKSSLQSRELNLSIREISAIKQVFERPITARTSSATSRNRNEASFRQKIRNIVCKAAARMNQKQDQKSITQDHLREQSEAVKEEIVQKQQELPSSQLSN